MIKKKLKVYSGLLLAAIVILTAGTIFNVSMTPPYATYADEEMSFSYEPQELTADTVNGRVLYNHELSVTVNVRPKGKQPVLVSKANEQSFAVEMTKVKLKIPFSKTPLSKALTIVPAVIFVIICTTFIIWIAWRSIKLVRSIRQGEIFDTKLSKGLEIMGIALTMLFFLELAAAYIITSIIARNVTLAYYTITGPDLSEHNYMLVIMGLSLMVISQIILIGKEIKDEQALTI